MTEGHQGEGAVSTVSQIFSVMAESDQSVKQWLKSVKTLLRKQVNQGVLLCVLGT